MQYALHKSGYLIKPRYCGKQQNPRQMKKVSISFEKYADANFQKKAELVYNSLTGNVAFESLASAVVAMKAALDAYSAALQASGTRERNAVAIKNQCRQQLSTLLSQLGLSVMVVAAGNEALLVSSGFTLNKTPEPRYISNPGNVVLSQGISTGEMLCMVGAVPGAGSYVHQLALEYPTEQTVWSSKASSARKFLFTNLIPGKQYWVRVAAIGTRNQVAYSTVATWFAQ